jgi:pimeloyl-ACP methyl ester carboxylesterase
MKTINRCASFVFMLGTALLAIVLLGACTGKSDGAGADLKPTLALKACRVKGVDTEVQCATLEVIENRDTKHGRKIRLNIVVLPALARVKEPDPIFLFAGGPGQASGDLAREALAMLRELNTKRDIVLIDQRGTGKSNFLNCKAPTPTDAELANSALRDAKEIKLTIACRDELTQRADLTQYTTTIAMADYDEVRAALGYNKINLFGASYGTRSSMEYLRRYPDHVRSVVIDGVAPPSMALPGWFSRDAGAAYDKVLADCAKEARCAAQFPNLKADVSALLTELGKAPKKTRIVDAVTGVAKEVEITHDMVLLSIFTALYVPEYAALLPSSITKARAGDYSPLLGLGGVLAESTEDKMAGGMHLSVICAEDMPRLTPAFVEAEAKREPFGRMFIDKMAKACEIWPKGKLAADFVTPVKSDKPVLIFSGGLDPVTPAVHGDEVKSSLSNAKHIIAQQIGHGVASHACGPKLVKAFIEKASVAGLDETCVQQLPRPIFFEPLKERKKETLAVANPSEKNNDKSGEKK